MSAYETTTVYSTVDDEPIRFVDCRWKVDDRGCLHIFRAPSSGPNVMVAAFGAGSWDLVHAEAEVPAVNAPSQIGRPWLDYSTVDPEYTGRLNALAAEVAQVFDEEEKQPARLASTRHSLELAQQYDALMAEAERKTRLRALRRRRWAELKAEHPPRKDDDGEVVRDDRRQEVNTATFFDAVMPETIINPDTNEPLYTPEACAEFSDTLSDGEWDDLCSTVWLLNERGVGIPKSSMVSLLHRRIGDDSDSPETSESQRPASQGWEPARRSEHYDADGNLTGYTITTVEPEWDVRAVDELLASLEVEGRMCNGCATDLGLSMDPDLAAQGVNVEDELICYVCRAKEAYERRLHEAHENNKAWWDGRTVVASLVSTETPD